MPLRVDQPASMEPGRAQVSGTVANGLTASGLELALMRVDRGSPLHLDPVSAEPWQAAETWFAPDDAGVEDGVLRFELAPTISQHLQPFMVYVVKLRDAAGRTVEDRMTWASIRLPSPAPAIADEAPISDVTAEPEPAAPPAAPNIPAEPDPLDHFEQLAATKPPPPEAIPSAEPVAPAVTARRPSRWLLPVLLLAAVVGAGALVYTGVIPSPFEQTDPAVAGVPLTLEGARSFLQEQTRQSPELMAEAGRFAAAGVKDGAFLLYREAARQGDPEAAIAVAQFYDPATFEAGGGPVAEANVETALMWYEQAAEAGSVDAMLRTGQLYRDQANQGDAPERAQFWLRKAADAGSAEARELLP